MRQILAIVILGSALTVAASAAFANDNGLRDVLASQPLESVAAQDQAPNVAVAGGSDYQHPATNPWRQENIVP